jgi:hypothetical protein
LRIASVNRSIEAVEHLLDAARGYLEDRAEIVSTADAGRALEMTFRVGD